jgi:phosphoribosylanthranilate isomerase
MTRAEDAQRAAQLGALYVGVIFAGGPRQLTTEKALDVLDDLVPDVVRVGVFAPPDETADAEILRTAERLGLGVLQIHTDIGARRLDSLRDRFAGEVWPVVRVAGGTLPTNARELVDGARTFLLDAAGSSGLGGTGLAFDWDAVADQLVELRAGRNFVLAGGLKPENVARAIEALQPDVVDVSSGVEQSPGIKDHQLMRAFSDAAHGAIKHA